MKSCNNCKYEVSSAIKFCPQCGQKTQLASLSLRMLIADFLSNFLNLEAKIWRTLRDIWIPGKLTTAFIEGQRISYYNPLRIFIIVLFTFFTLFVISFNETFFKLDSILNEQKTFNWKKDLESHFDSLTLDNKFSTEQNLLIREKIFETSRGDSLKLKDRRRSKKDTVYNINSSQFKSDSLDGLFSDLEVIFSSEVENDSTSEVRTRDFLMLSEEQFKEKHSSENKLKEAFLIQSHKLINNPSSSLRFIIGNGTWAIIALIFMMAFLFKLLYIRSNYLYAEHFLFHLYGHTRILLLSIGILLLHKFKDFESWGTIFIIVVGLLYLFLGMKKFYGQSIFKTMLKFLATILFYSIAIILCNLIILGISYLVF